MRVQLSVALQGIMTQQLLPTADGSGRVVACEVLVPNPAVRNLIREGKTHQIYSVLQTGSALGMQTMDTALAALVRSGKITQKLAEARSSTPEELRRLLGAREPGGGLGANRMSTYVFKAIDLTGGKARGEVEAESKQAVADQLKARGLIVLDIADKHKSREIELAFMKLCQAAELAVFSRQFATMISSGMSILRALYVLEEQTESKFLKETIVAVRKDVEAGLSLSDSMASHPKVFSPLFVAMVQAGETGGVLEGALMRVADQLEKDASLRRQVRSAMVYPTLVIIFALGVMIALVAFLIPVFVGVFKKFGGELPAITKVSVFASKVVTGYWWAMFIGTAVAVVRRSGRRHHSRPCASCSGRYARTSKPTAPAGSAAPAGPAALKTAIDPPSAATLSRMPIKPSPLLRTPTSAPRPLSAMEISIPGEDSARPIWIRTRVADECRATLVRASCTSRNRTSARDSASASNSGPQAISICAAGKRERHSFTQFSSAAARPNSSRPTGRNWRIRPRRTS